MNKADHDKFQKSNDEHIENCAFLIDINYLKEQELNGFYMAKVMLRVFEKFDKIGELLRNYKEGMEDEILSIGADVFYSGVFFGITQEFQDKILGLVSKVMNMKNNKATASENSVSKLDKNARIVQLGFKLLNSSSDALVFSEECLQKYPDVPYFYMLKMTICLQIDKSEEGARIGKEATNKFPDNIDIHFLYANHYEKLLKEDKVDFGKLEQVKKLFNNFIDLAPKDHPKVPEAYYFIAKSHVSYSLTLAKLTTMSKGLRSQEYEMMGLENIRNVRKYYEIGLEAEKIQLPRYQPADFPVKEIIELFFDSVQATFGFSFNNSGQMFKTAFGDKTIRRFKEHRASIKAHKEAQFLEKKCDLKNENLSKSEQNSLFYGFHPSTKGFKATLLPIIEKKLNHTFKRFYIELTVVDDPDVNFETNEIGLLVQDNVICLTKVIIDNINMKNIDNKEYIENYFGFGCKIVISDPFYTVDQNGLPIIQVDDLNSVMITGDKDVKRCRYCGNPKGTLSCSKCSRNYCSKECQIKDWKNFDHKLICGLSN